jgi:trehalose/maltose hydrolase-like predicted phosphorylase
MGAMAGTVDIVQRCYTGIVMRGDILWLDPMLPKAIIRLSFVVRYRDQSLEFDVSHDRVKVHALHSCASPIKVGYRQQIYDLKAGETKVMRARQPYTVVSF